MINLHNCDCMEFMAGLPDKAFDLAIVDPPYGMIGRTFTCKTKALSRSDKKWSELDRTHSSGLSLGLRPMADYFNELRRVSINYIVWGMQYFVPNLEPHTCVIVWDKENGTNRFSDAEIAHTSFDTAVRIYRGWNEPRGENGNGRIHPTQKPVALYRWLLQNYAKPGQKILDTHLGSMSSVIACIEEGYSIDGCEMDKDYYEAGMKRVQNHLAQQNMFRPEDTSPIAPLLKLDL